MTNTELLNEVIKKSGLKREWIAEQLGITRAALSLKIKNKNDFKAVEVDRLSKILALPNKQRDAIFFAQCVDFKST